MEKTKPDEKQQQKTHTQKNPNTKNQTHKKTVIQLLKLLVSLVDGNKPFVHAPPQGRTISFMPFLTDL